MREISEAKAKKVAESEAMIVDSPSDKKRKLSEDSEEDKRVKCSKSSNNDGKGGGSDLGGSSSPGSDEGNPSPSDSSLSSIAVILLGLGGVIGNISDHLPGSGLFY